MVMIAVLLAWSIDFCLQALIGLAAFVSEDVSAYDWIYQKLLFILGGMLIPVDFFPAWLQKVAQALPFQYAMYGPARLFVEPEAGQFLQAGGGAGGLAGRPGRAAGDCLPGRRAPPVGERRLSHA